MKIKNKNILPILIVGIINLMLLYFVKYSSNELSISYFSIAKTGNMINLILTIIFAIGCILIVFSENEINLGNIRFITILSIVYIFPLIVIIFLNFFNIQFIDAYFLGYPIKKIIPVILYVLNQVGFIYVLFIVWYIYLGKNLLSYLYSLISLVVLILTLIIFSFVNTYLVDEHHYLSADQKFDYGIVLGAAVWSKDKPSPIFRGRIEKGADLYLNNVVDKLQLTGGNAPGELSEAKAAYNYLVSSYDVMPENIIIEEATSTTNEQIKYIKEQFSNRDRKDKFIFISDDFHLRRIEEMADFYEVNANVVSSEYKLNFEKSLYYRLRESIGLVLFWFFAI